MKERERILKLLEDGKITADEAAKLLEALGEPLRFAHPGNRPDFGERIARKVVKGLPEMIENSLRFMNPSNGEERELNFNPKDRFIVKAVSGDLNIKGDNESKIRVKLQNGFKVNKTETEIALKTTSGDLDISLPKTQNLDIKAATGDISASNLDAELSFRCAAGDIKLEDIKGNIAVGLASGDLNATKISAEIKAALGFGDANIDFIECMGGKVEVGYGDITLNLPEDSNLELTLIKPEKGSIVSEFEFETPENIEAFKFTIGKPGTKLYLKTKNGDIIIRKRRNK